MQCAKKGIITEFLGEEFFFRSLRCKGIVPFTASASTCRPCQHYVKFNGTEDSPNSLKEPVFNSNEENNVFLPTTLTLTLGRSFKEFRPQQAEKC